MTQIKEKYRADGEQEEKNDGANFEGEREDDEEENMAKDSEDRGGLPAGFYGERIVPGHVVDMGRYDPSDPFVEEVEMSDQEASYTEGGSWEEDEEESLVVDYSDSSIEQTRDMFVSNAGEEDEEEEEEEKVQEESKREMEESEESKEDRRSIEDEPEVQRRDVIILDAGRDDARPIEVIDLTSIASSPAETDDAHDNVNIPRVNFFCVAAILRMLDDADMVEDEVRRNKGTDKSKPSSP